MHTSTEAADSTHTARSLPVTLSEHSGVRYLYFGNDRVQGAMRIGMPDWLELEYARHMMTWMLFKENPRHIVQLGLGTGSLSKFCYRHHPEARITAVELNPAVISICRSMFHLPANDDRLTVIEMDAMAFVNDAANRGTADVLQVDLYDATLQGPVLDTPQFYAACARCLRPGGIMTVNLFADYPSFAKNLVAIRTAFGTTLWTPRLLRGNAIAIAFKTAPQFDFPRLHERAFRVKQETGLPMDLWCDSLRSWEARSE